uniref:Uncharacterized protein n=1 Tax=Romanomermis culicivorax TaxID=13658 RepID=A0A915IAE5_ROMCU
MTASCQAPTSVIFPAGEKNRISNSPINMRLYPSVLDEKAKSSASPPPASSSASASDAAKTWCKSSSCSFFEIRRSVILSSSRTKVAVKPNLQCAWTMVKTRRNILAGINELKKICVRFIIFDEALYNLWAKRPQLTVQNDQTPFLVLQPFHHLFGFERPFPLMGQHGVGGNGHDGDTLPRAGRNFVSRFPCKSYNFVIFYSRPHLRQKNREKVKTHNRKNRYNMLEATLIVGDELKYV